MLKRLQFSPHRKSKTWTGLILLMFNLLFPASSMRGIPVEPSLPELQAGKGNVDPDLKARALELLNRSKRYRRINLDSSAWFLGQAMSVAAESGAQDLVTRISMSDGALQYMQGNYELAATRYLDAIEFWEQDADTVEIIRCNLNLGNVYVSSRELKKAVPVLHKALRMARHSNEQLMTAQSLGTLGNVYHNMGLSDSTLYYRNLTTKAFREMGDTANVGRSLINVSLTYSQIGQTLEARTYLQEALELLEGSTVIGVLAEGYNNAGTLEYRLGNYPGAVEYGMKAQAIFRKLGWRKKLLTNHILMGQCLYTWGRLEAAREQHRIALKLADSLGIVNHKATALSGLAFADLQTGQPELAISRFREALALESVLEGKFNSFPKYLGIVQAYRKLGKADSAMLVLEKGMVIARKDRNEVNLGDGFFERGELHLEMGGYAKALVDLDSAAFWFGISNHPEGLKKVAEKRAACYEAMGDYVKALQAQREATRWRDSLFSSSATEQLMQLEARYWSEKKQHSLELARKNEALQTQEAARARDASAAFAAQRNWAIIVLVLVIVLGALAWRLNTQRKKNELRHKLSEMRMMALRAQMNPHFIFNALGSVQLLINTNNVREANLYLSKFARLLRWILENSGQQTVSVAEEADGLRLYIELEALRFKFQHAVQVSHELDADGSRIPAMLIQPFIENSIKHGISGKQQSGSLEVAFALQDGELYVRVEDNGIGRQAALAKKQTSPPEPKASGKRTSLGMTLVRERLELMRPYKKERMKITDLRDTAGNAAGTLVELWLPMQEP